MTRYRRFKILDLCKVWQNDFPDMTIKDCFFALLVVRDITSKELDYLMDWMTL